MPEQKGLSPELRHVMNRAVQKSTMSQRSLAYLRMLSDTEVYPNRLRAAKAESEEQALARLNAAKLEGLLDVSVLGKASPRRPPRDEPAFARLFDRRIHHIFPRSERWEYAGELPTAWRAAPGDFDPPMGVQDPRVAAPCGARVRSRTINPFEHVSRTPGPGAFDPKLPPATMRPMGELDLHLPYGSFGLAPLPRADGRPAPPGPHGVSSPAVGQYDPPPPIMPRAPSSGGLVFGRPDEIGTNDRSSAALGPCAPRRPLRACPRAASPYATSCHSICPC